MYIMFPKRKRKKRCMIPCCPQDGSGETVSDGRTLVSRLGADGETTLFLSNSIYVCLSEEDKVDFGSSDRGERGNSISRTISL